MENIVIDIKLKQCKNCKEELSLDNYYKDSKTKDKLSSYCKKCHCDRGKLYRKNNPLSEEKKKKKLRLKTKNL